MIVIIGTIHYIYSTALAKPIWIVSDVRRKTDIEWFQKNFNNVITIRIMTDDITRKSRGFIYTIGNFSFNLLKLK